MLTDEMYAAIHEDIYRIGHHAELCAEYVFVAGRPDLVTVLHNTFGETAYVCGAVAVFGYLATRPEVPEYDAFWQEIARLAAQVEMTLTAEAELPTLPKRIYTQVKAFMEWREAHPDR